MSTKGVLGFFSGIGVVASIALGELTGVCGFGFCVVVLVAL